MTCSNNEVDRMEQISSPMANAILVCDSVINEAVTNKNSLIGIFENINVTEFPYVHHSLCVYVKLTQIRGKHSFRLELVDLQNNTINAKIETPEALIKDGQKTTSEFVYTLNSLPFKHAGDYEFRLFIDQTLVSKKGFRVRKQPRRK